MKQKLEASYTVEAAFIIPLVFALLCGVVFLAFRLHDVATLRQCAWEGAFYGAGQLEMLSKKEISDYVQERLEEKLFISDTDTITVIQGDSEVSVGISGESERLRFAEGLLGYEQGKHFKVKHTAKYPAAPQYVRRGLIISSKIKGLWDREEEEHG